MTRTRRSPWLLLGLAFLLASAPLLGVAHADEPDEDGEHDHEDGRGPGNDNGRGRNGGGLGLLDDDDEDDERDEDDDEDEGTDRALGLLRAKGRGGHFTVDNGTFQGRFVSFRVDVAAGTVHAFAVENATVFSRIAASQPFDELDAEAGERGARVELEGDDVELKIHDNPSALVKLEADDRDDDEDDPDGGANGTALTLVLAPGVTATRDGERRLALSWSGATASLHGNRPLGLANGTVTVTGEAVFLVHQARTLLPAAANRDRDALDDALAARSVGAEVTIVRAEGGALVTQTVATRDLLLNVTSDEEGLHLVVDSPDHAGTVLVLAIDRDLLDDDAFGIRFFDVTGAPVELPIVAASSLADVLNPHDDGLVAEFRAVRDVDGWQLLVSIPGFSAKRIDLAPSSLDLREAPPLLLAGLLAAVAATGVATWTMFRRPRDGA